MRELCILLSLVWVFFLLLLCTKQQQERKMQEADEPGTGVQIRREQGDQAVTAGWPRDSVPATWKPGDQP